MTHLLKSIYGFSRLRVGLIRQYFRWPTPMWRLCGHATLTIASYQLKFCLFNYFWLHNMRRGLKEPGVAEFLADQLKPGDTFIDIGAWIGPYTILASKLVGSDGHVYAFEPDPVARKALQENIELNQATNVTVLPLAVSDCSQKLLLVSSKFGNSVSHIQTNSINSEEEHSVEVEAVSLNTFIQEQNIKSFHIKIDVEGAEAKVFAGGLEALRQAKTVFLEIHEKELRNFGVDPRAFWHEVCTLGKAIYRANTQGDAFQKSELFENEKLSSIERLVLIPRS